MFSSTQIQTFKNTIDAYQTFGVCTHVDPDGDAIGSALWLGEWLKKQGKHIEYFVPNPLPETLTFLPATKQFEHHITSTHLEKIDCRISVDTATKSRSNLSAIQTSRPIVHIDHHPPRELWGDIHLVDDGVSSCAELVFQLISAIDETAIDASIATALLMGISTDTGHFTRGNDLTQSLHAAHQLMALGGDMPLIIDRIYHTATLHDLRIIGTWLANVQQHDQFIRAYIDDPESTAVSDHTVKRFLSLLQNMAYDGVIVLCISYPHAATPSIKCSLRTNNPLLDVAKLASEFGGGGHRAAAAFRTTAFDDIASEVEKIKKMYQQILTKKV